MAELESKCTTHTLREFQLFIQLGTKKKAIGDKEQKNHSKEVTKRTNKPRDQTNSGTEERACRGNAMETRPTGTEQRGDAD